MIVISDGPVVRENTGVMPLSVEAEEFSLRTVPKNRVPTGEGSDGSGNCVPSQEVHGKVVMLWYRRSDAVVSTTAVAGAASPADFAEGGSPGRPCRDRCSGRCRNEILGRCPQLYSSTVDDEGAP